ncbi:MAG: hypothetical protein ACLPMG_09455 [Terriglobales bacterium]
MSMLNVILGCACIVLAIFAWRLNRLTSKLRLEIDTLKRKNEQSEAQLVQATQKLAEHELEVHDLQQKYELMATQFEQAAQKLAEHEKPQDSNGNGLFQRVVENLISLGVPGLVLLVAVSISGFAGAAALTSALAVLGGPWGMAGGISLLILLALVSKALTEYGLPKLAHAVISGLIAKGETSPSIRKKVDSLPKWAISMKLRTKIDETLAEAQGDLGGEHTK